MVQDQVIHSMIKSKLNSNEAKNSQNINLSTHGNKSTIQINPSTSKHDTHISTKTLDKIKKSSWFIQKSN